MKVVLTYIVALAYLVFSTGLNVNVHFCMGEIDAITVGGTADDTCGKCGMHTEDSKGCCNDENSIYKIDDDQQNQFAQVLIPQMDWDITTPISYALVAKTPINKEQLVYGVIHGPPFIKDRCILNQVFRI